MMLGGWPASQMNGSREAAQRSSAHVNPLPARKPSKRAKYGDRATVNKENRLARVPKPPVVRPRPKRATEYFRELIRSAEERLQRTGEEAEEAEDGERRQSRQQKQSKPQNPRPPPLQQQQQHQEQQQPQPQPQPQEHPRFGSAHTGLDVPSRDEQTKPPASGPHPDVAAPDGDFIESSAGASNPTLEEGEEEGAAGLLPAAAEVGPAGFRRRRKLFADSYEGPHPRTTAKIVARLAACRHWRRPLAHRLLPRFLPLFDQHAAAYFFKHVPSLQPRPPVPSALPYKNPTSASTLADPRSSSAAIFIWAADESAIRYGAITGSGGSSGEYPRNYGNGGGGGGRSAVRRSDEAGFRRMVVAVCCSLLPKMASFGPRALANMATGLGRMGIRHGPTLAAWEVHSTPQLGLMRPDQLVASLEGLAALGASAAPSPAPTSAAPAAAAAAAATASAAAAGAAPDRTQRRLLWRQRQRRRWGLQSQQQRLPPLGCGWREAALAAARSALPRMTVAEVGRMLLAMAPLRLCPPPDLLTAACDRVQRAVAEEAERLAAAIYEGGLGGASASVGDMGGGAASEGDDGGNMSTATARTSLFRIAMALAEVEARRSAVPYTVGTVSAAGGAVGVVAAAAATAAATVEGDRAKRKGERAARRGSADAAAAPRLPPLEPVRGRDVARVVGGLGALGFPPPGDWMVWLLGSVEEVLKAAVGAGQQRRIAAAGAAVGAAAAPADRLTGGRERRMIAAGATAEKGASGWAAGGAISVAVESAPQETAVPPYFSAEDLAELAAGLADLVPLMLPTAEAEAAEPAGPAGVATSQAHARAQEHEGIGGSGGASLSPQPPRPSVSAEWLNLLLEAALDDVWRRLDPATAAAAAAAAVAAAPTAVLTRGDVTKADADAVAAAAGTAASVAAAAADAVPAASCLLAAMLRLLPYYTPPRRWCLTAAGLGLELVPFMQPSALLLWLRSLAAWGAPRPLPPPWTAAAAVSSRTRLGRYTTQQLWELPACLAATGARMSGPWAAHYVRHLADRLAAAPGQRLTACTAPQHDKTACSSAALESASTSTSQFVSSRPPSSQTMAGQAGQVGSAASRRGRQQRGGGGGRQSLRLQVAVRRRPGIGIGGAAAGGVQEVAPEEAFDAAMSSPSQPSPRLASSSCSWAGDEALRNVATALGWLPYLVPDLRYVGECEGASLQALARAFGCLEPAVVQPPLPPPPQLAAPAIPVTTGPLSSASISPPPTAAAAPRGGMSTGPPRRGQDRDRGGEGVCAPPPLESKPEGREAVAAFLAAAGFAAHGADEVTYASCPPDCLGVRNGSSRVGSPRGGFRR